MSRGGRGGRGGARGGGNARPKVPWDTGDEPDARPSELFPVRSVPTPRPLSSKEKTSIDHFLILRHQFHSSPLHASRKSSLHDPTAPRKLYGQAQMNANYDVRDKATLDPFTAVPAYSHKFVPRDRALPDWSSLPVCREVFPPELRSTVEPGDGDDGLGRKKRPRLELSNLGSLPSAEEAFGFAAAGASSEAALLDRLNALPVNEDDEDGAAAAAATAASAAAAAADADEDEQLQEDDGDEVYDDEDAGDYDAENYFDNGDDMGDDYGDGDDGEGTY
ncbi:hypothetical protein L249_4952 [Ophiocordyceps polyrhachis-furcata BCC 54312]|uniref:DNA-directed RNA polymerase III subunit n=1 Tax=Ophiocordyceps polyrhachis-furcata BCC 54312 TaxID=1330021 RepID=A0A367L3Q7_9HYPO|nr:hypothetical protein L249_4952 [Ophiocordyceps polyrhachis-furcata BCC 54312]